jgi:DNA-binding Lrp family transcriptional regulator
VVVPVCGAAARTLDAGGLRPRPPVADEREVQAVVQAYILIQTEVGRAADVAARLATLPGVTHAEDITGPYDVIVRAEAADMTELTSLVTAQMHPVPGLTRTITCPVVHL